MEIKHKKRSFHVSLKAAGKILILHCFLHVKRVKRFAWRVAKNSVPSLCTLFLWGIFLLVSYCYGVSQSLYSGNLKQYIWDARIALFTSVILVWVLAIWTNEKSHRRRLFKQHSLYIESMYAFQSLIERCWVELHISRMLPRDCLYTQDRVHETWEYLTHIKESDHLSAFAVDARESNWQWDIHSCKLALEHLKTAFEHGEIIGGHPSDSLDVIFGAKTLLAKLEQNTSNNYKSFIELFIGLLSSMHRLVADCRRPWRWDMDVDYAILTTLKNEDTTYVSEENEYYWSLFFPDEV